MARDVPAGAGFAYTVAMRTLDEQLRRIEALDTKAGVLIAAGGLVIGLLAGDQSSLVVAPIWIQVTVLGAVTTSLLLSLLAFTARRYELAPTPDAAMRLVTATADWLEWRFLGNLSDAIGANQPEPPDESAAPLGRPHGADCSRRRARRILAGARDHHRGVTMASEAKTEEDEARYETRIPRPVPGGTLYLESLGRFIDNLMGASRRSARARAELEPILIPEDEMPDDPPPTEPPPPVPGGTDPESRGARPETTP